MTTFEDKLLKRVERMASDLQAGSVTKYRVTQVRVGQVAPPAPPPKYSSVHIRELRQEKLGVSQRLFSQMVVMSLKTVQAWEQGTRVPKGPVLRLLQVIERDPQRFLEAFRSSAATVSPPQPSKTGR